MKRVKKHDTCLRVVLNILYTVILDFLKWVKSFAIF